MEEKTNIRKNAFQIFFEKKLWIYVTALLAISVFVMSLSIRYLGNIGEIEFDHFTNVFSLFMAIIIPILSIILEANKKGEKDYKVGKDGYLVIFTISLIFILIYSIFMYMLSNIYMSEIPIFSYIIGNVFVCAYFTAISYLGICISQKVHKNPYIGIIYAYVIIWLPYLILFALNKSSLIIKYLNPFMYGYIATMHVLIYAVIVNLILITNEYIQNDKNTVKANICKTLVVLSLIALSVAAMIFMEKLDYFARIDLTKGKIYTLKIEDIDVIKNVDKKVKITYYGKKDNIDYINEKNALLFTDGKTKVNEWTKKALVVLLENADRLNGKISFEQKKAESDLKPEYIEISFENTDYEKEINEIKEKNPNIDIEIIKENVQKDIKIFLDISTEKEDELDTGKTKVFPQIVRMLSAFTKEEKDNNEVVILNTLSSNIDLLQNSKKLMAPFYRSINWSGFKIKDWDGKEALKGVKNLVIPNLLEDINEETLKNILEFKQKGGNILIMPTTKANINKEEKYPNFEKLLLSYGAKVDLNSIVIDFANENRHIIVDLQKKKENKEDYIVFDNTFQRPNLVDELFKRQIDNSLSAQFRLVSPTPIYALSDEELAKINVKLRKITETSKEAKILRYPKQDELKGEDVQRAEEEGIYTTSAIFTQKLENSSESKLIIFPSIFTASRLPITNYVPTQFNYAVGDLKENIKYTNTMVAEFRKNPFEIYTKEKPNAVNVNRDELDKKIHEIQKVQYITGQLLIGLTILEIILSGVYIAITKRKKINKN